MELIDLHAHTTASDGSLSPAQLVEAALRAGLAAIGVTDHDTADAVPEAMEAGASLGIRVVPGIEISCVLEGGTLHILGYEFNISETRFSKGVDRLKLAREERNPKIIRNLRELGIPITMEQVEERAGGGVVGRPHIAKALLDLGTVKTVQEAFDSYLANDSPAYEHKFRYEPAVAFEMIKGAGGIPVMAHPYQTRRKGEDLRQLVSDLTEQGLEGIEVLYSRHSPEQVEFYSELAREFDLVPTGGTDFHGKTKPDIALGTGSGDLKVPLSILNGIDARVAAIRQRRA
ncbi:PHP domain-containing protein [Candidatus Zixiibacteriota bacterium]